jgi:cyanate lyase
MTAADLREYRSPNRRHDRRVFYKYVTAEVAKIILTTRRLRWSSPLLFNDPFDVTQELRLDFGQAEINAVLTERWASLLEHEVPDISFEDPKLNLKVRLIRESPPEARRAVAEELRQIAQPTDRIPGHQIARTCEQCKRGRGWPQPYGRASGRDRQENRDQIESRTASSSEGGERVKLALKMEVKNMSTVTATPTSGTAPAAPMSKLEMTEVIMAAKFAKGASWADISAAAAMSEIFVVSACLGQNTLPAEAAAKVADYLGLGNRTKDVEIALQLPPKKAQEAETVSKDPLIYRFHEITYIYGDTIKEIIHEKFGDGIMSAIDFDLKIDKVEHPKGDRVKVTMTGKFLPYNQW